MVLSVLNMIFHPVFLCLVSFFPFEASVLNTLLCLRRMNVTLIPLFLNSHHLNNPFQIPIFLDISNLDQQFRHREKNPINSTAKNEDGKMSQCVTQSDDFQLLLLHLKWDKVVAWQGTNNYCIQWCLCHSHENACVGFIRREKTTPENIVKYITGLIRALVLSTILQCFSAFTVHDFFSLTWYEDHILPGTEF